MLLGIIVRELWPRRRELLLAALLLLIWRAIVSFVVELLRWDIGIRWQRDVRHSDHRRERVHPASDGNQAMHRVGRTQMKTISARELSAAELEAVSGGSPNLTVPAGMFDKLFAAIDKNLEMVKQLPKGGYLPPG